MEPHQSFTELDVWQKARGSLSEPLNHLIDAFDCGYINKEQLVQFKVQTDGTGKILNGYISYLRKNL
ncbi:MAG TPA: four helix bundle protein [Flavisolibacter sp.]